MMTTWNLLRSDFKNIIRDGILLFVICTPFITALAFRWGVPYLSELLLYHFDFDLTAYYDLMMSMLVMTTPMMFGFIIGFLLLDERDEQILNFIAITPLSKKGYIIYRIGFPIVSSFILSYIILWISDLAAFSILKMIPVAFMASMQAPMLALIMVAYAANKVEGLALFKGLNMLLFLPPIAGYLIPSQWGLLLGMFPTFYVTQAFAASYESTSSYILYSISGLVLHLLFVMYFLRRFIARTD